MVKVSDSGRPPLWRRIFSWLRHMTWRDLFWYLPKGYVLRFLYGRAYVHRFFHCKPPRSRREQRFRERLERCMPCFTAGYCLKCGCPDPVAVILSGKKCNPDED